MSTAPGSQSPDGDQSKEQRSSRYSDFGNAFACLFMALLFFAAPSYFALTDILESLLALVGYPFLGYYVGCVLSIVCYVLAVLCLLFVGSFTSNAFKKHPELKRFFQGPGGSEDAWQGAFAATTFFAIAVCLHYVVITNFGAAGIIAVTVKLVVYVFVLFGGFMAATALDGFVVKPLLSSLSLDGPDRETLVTRVRKIGTAIAVSITILAALAQIIDVTLK